MKKTLLLSVFVLMTCLIYAQTSNGTGGGYGSTGVSDGANTFMNIVKVHKNDSNYNKLDGSYYLLDDWKSIAQIYDINKKGYKLKNCNFNVKLNQLESMYDEAENKIFAFNSKDISTLKIGNKIFVNKNIDLGANKLLEVIYEGDNLSLFKYHESNLLEASINPMTIKKMGKDIVEITSSYYIEKDSNMEAIKLKKSSILKLMSNKKDEVKIFIKENKLSVSEDADLFKIFQYYNSL